MAVHPLLPTFKDLVSAIQDDNAVASSGPPVSPLEPAPHVPKPFTGKQPCPYFVIDQEWLFGPTNKTALAFFIEEGENAPRDTLWRFSSGRFSHKIIHKLSIIELLKQKAACTLRLVDLHPNRGAEFVENAVTDSTVELLRKEIANFEQSEGRPVADYEPLELLKKATIGIVASRPIRNAFDFDVGVSFSTVDAYLKNAPDLRTRALQDSESMPSKRIYSSVVKARVDEPWNLCKAEEVASEKEFVTHQRKLTNKLNVTVKALAKLDEELALFRQTIDDASTKSSVGKSSEATSPPADQPHITTMKDAMKKAHGEIERVRKETRLVIDNARQTNDETDEQVLARAESAVSTAEESLEKRTMNSDKFIKYRVPNGLRTAPFASSFGGVTEEQLLRGVVYLGSYTDRNFATGDHSPEALICAQFWKRVHELDLVGSPTSPPPEEASQLPDNPTILVRDRFTKIVAVPERSAIAHFIRTFASSFCSVRRVEYLAGSEVDTNFLILEEAALRYACEKCALFARNNGILENMHDFDFHLGILPGASKGTNSATRFVHTKGKKGKPGSMNKKTSQEAPFNSESFTASHPTPSASAFRDTLDKYTTLEDFTTKREVSYEMYIEYGFVHDLPTVEQVRAMGPAMYRYSRLYHCPKGDAAHYHQCTRRFRHANYATLDANMREYETLQATKRKAQASAIPSSQESLYSAAALAEAQEALSRDETVRQSEADSVLKHEEKRRKHQQDSAEALPDAMIP